MQLIGSCVLAGTCSAHDRDLGHDVGENQPDAARTPHRREQPRRRRSPRRIDRVSGGERQDQRTLWRRSNAWAATTGCPPRHSRLAADTIPTRSRQRRRGAFAQEDRKFIRRTSPVDLAQGGLASITCSTADSRRKRMPSARGLLISDVERFENQLADASQSGRAARRSRAPFSRCRRTRCSRPRRTCASVRAPGRGPALEQQARRRSDACSGGRCSGPAAAPVRS